VEVKFSPDGKLLAVGGGGFRGGVPNLVLFEAATGKTVLELEHEHHLSGAAFLDGGKTLVSVGSMGTVWWTDVATGQRLRAWKPKPAPPAAKGDWRFTHFEHVVFTPDGKLMLATAQWYDPSKKENDDDVVHHALVALDLTTGKERWRSRAFDRIVLSPDGERFAAGQRDRGGPFLLETATGKRIRRLPALDADEGQEEGPWGLCGLAFGPDGKTLFAGLHDHGVCQWDLASGKVVKQYRPRAALPWTDVAVAAAPDGRRVLAWAGQRLWLWDAESGQEVAGTDGHSGFVNYVRFTDGGKELLTAVLSRGARTEELLRWDAATGKLLQRFGRHQKEAPGAEDPSELRDQGGRWAVTATPHGKRTAWFDKDGTIHVAGTDGKVLRQFRAPLKPWEKPPDYPPVLALAPDGKWLASWEWPDNGVHVWDVTTGKRYRRLPGRDLGGLDFTKMRRLCLAFAPDGRTLAVGAMANGHDVELWELASGKVRQVLRGHRGPVAALAFSEDGRLLASGSEDTTVLVWDVLTPSKE
jgi:WD40 repeat protein